MIVAPTSSPATNTADGSTVRHRTLLETVREPRYSPNVCSINYTAAETAD
jgi:hypothetical protein